MVLAEIHGDLHATKTPGTPSVGLASDADGRATSIYYGPSFLQKNSKQLVLQTKVLNYGGILWFWDKKMPKRK